MAPIKTVALVGANGLVGSVLLQHLLSAGFSITVLQRASSSSSSSASSLPSTVRAVPVPDDFPVDALASALSGHDALVCAFPVVDAGPHLRLAEAAFAAGVSRVITSDWGSVEAHEPHALRYVPIYAGKDSVRRRCIELASQATAENKPFSWTTVVCGHFFDAGFKDGYLAVDLDARTSVVLDGGVTRASCSTLRRVGEACVAVLQRPDKTANRLCLVQSFCAAQKDMLAAVERAHGGEWTRSEENSDDFFARHKKLYDEGDKGAVVSLVFALGTLYADWTGREELAMEDLGLRDEDMDEVVREIVADWEKEGNK